MNMRTVESRAQWWRVASPSHDHRSVSSEPGRAEPSWAQPAPEHRGWLFSAFLKCLICWKEDNVRLVVSLNQTAVLMCPRAKMVRTIRTSAAGSRSKEVRVSAPHCHGHFCSPPLPERKSQLHTLGFFLLVFFCTWKSLCNFHFPLFFPPVWFICRTRWRSPPFTSRWLLRLLSPLLRCNLLLTPLAGCSLSCSAMGNSFLVRGIRQTSPTTESGGAFRHQLLSPN